MDYKASGVDIDAGNEIVRRIRALARSTYTVARQVDGRIGVTDHPVLFTIVQPGHTLLNQAAAE